MSEITLLGITGSLRRQSYNRALLMAAKELLPSSCKLDIVDLGDLPLFNEDNENPLPPSVHKLKKQVQEARGILLATPEYNFSMPGVLKNGLDWVSRPSGQSAWDGKLIGMMGASQGQMGTSRAQYHLRQVFVALNMRTFNRPEFMLPSCGDKFDPSGKLIDPNARDKLSRFLKSFVDHVLSS